MLVYDVETDGLLDELTVIHCLHILDRATGQRDRYSSGVYADGSPAHRSGSVEDGLRRLEQADDICGHNVIRFDNKAIKKLYPWWNPRGRIHDTLVYAQLIWTNLKEIDSQAMKEGKRPPQFTGLFVGKQSLESWGYRLGVLKGDYSAVMKAKAKDLGITDEAELAHFVWGTFTLEMDDYCELDVVGTDALMTKIESKGYSAEAMELEIEVAKIIDLQVAHGFEFDMAACEKLVAHLMSRRAELTDKLRETFHPWYEPCLYKGAHDVLTPSTNNKSLGYVKGCPLTKVKLVTFNPGSRDQISNRMRALFQWVPTEFTPGGAPKVDEETLQTIDAPEAQMVVEYLTVDKRLGQAAEGDKSWLHMVKPDGRMHGDVAPNGAVTGRMTHFRPNMNVPKVKVGKDGKPLLGYEGGYGWECRSLFKVGKRKKLVGTDAEGLELRMLAHYMARFDGGAYVQAVAFGDKKKGEDAHSINMRAIGLHSRDNAKTFIYAYLYGSGNPNLGYIVYFDMTDAEKAVFNARVRKAEERTRQTGGDDTEVRARFLGTLGKQARERIEGGLPALGKLMDLIKVKAKRGFILGLDGRRIHIRSLHAALNSVLQGGGAVVMKRALVLTYQKFLALGWEHGREFAFVANVHDEFQMEVDEEHAETAAACAEAAITEAGETFRLLCPLAGSSNIGDHWAASH